MSKSTLNDEQKKAVESKIHVAPQPVEKWIENNSISDVKLSWNDPWLTLEIHRPAQRNALNGNILAHLKQLFDFIEAQKSIRAVVITGGEGAFCSGADLQEIARLRASGPDALVFNNKSYGELLHRIHLCRVPVISTVDGPALGGGMGIACASDMILSTHNASFGMPEPKLGIIAGQIFPYVFRKLGLVRTQEMALQGLRIPGNLSEHWGLANSIYPDYTAMETGLQSILSNIMSCGPDALSTTKTMLNQLTSVSHQDIDTTAKAVVMATLSTEGAEGGMAFMAKRKPSWNQQKIMES